MFKQVLDGMRDGVMVLGAGDRIVYANAAVAALFAIPPDSFFGKRPLEVVRLVELVELIEAVRQSGAPQSREMKIVYPAEKVLSASADAVKTEEGDLVAVVIQDVSEIKKLEAIRQEFVANVSHELKTPLTAIKSYAETLLNGAIDDRESNRRFLEKIEKNAASLAALIDDMLEISRFEAHRGIAPFEPFPLVEEIDRALETLGAKIREKQLEIVKQGEPENCEVVGEASHIYRAVLNLLDNAVKYSPAGGKIEINCAKNGPELRLSVKDEGPGIPAEHQGRIFERFYRVDKARSRDLGGTGLGLSIVKHVMEIHGGRVELTSGDGDGAKFTLVFPQS